MAKTYDLERKQTGWVATCIKQPKKEIRGTSKSAVKARAKELCGSNSYDLKKEERFIRISFDLEKLLANNIIRVIRIDGK